MKTIFKIVLVIIVGGIISTIYYFSSFKLFDEPELVEICKIKNKGKADSLVVVYFKGNTTVQSSIQLRKKGQKKAIKFYERYNYLNSLKVNDNILELILSDTSIMNSKPDTIKIPFSDIQK